MSDRRPANIGLSLVGIVLVAILPLLVFGGGVAWTVIERTKAAKASELAGTARALRLAVDRELVNQLEAMAVLATDSSLDGGDLGLFMTRARRAMDMHPEWRNVALIDPHTHFIIASTATISAPTLASLVPGDVDKVVNTRKPVIAGLLPLGRIVRGPMILLLSPVVRRGEVRLVLSVGMNPKSVSRVFAAQGLAETWTGSVVENHMLLAGRSRDRDRFFGVRATPSLVERIAAAESGMFTALDEDGADVYTVFSRSPVTGWSVALGVPVAEVDEPIRLMLLKVGGAGVALIAFALILTLVLGKGIVRRRKAYETALRASEEALARESQRNSLYLRNASDGIHVLDAEGKALEVSDSFCDMLGYTRSELIGAYVSLWDGRWSPDELKRELKRQIEATGRSVFETKHRRRDGSLFDVEVTGQPLELDGQPVVFNSARDITERKRADRLLRTRLRLSELAQAGTMDRMLQEALDIAERVSGSQIGFFYFVDPDQEHLTQRVCSTKTLNACGVEGRGRHYAISEAGVWAECFHKRVPVIHNDYASLPQRKSLPEGQVPVMRELVVPIIRQGKVTEFMGVGNKPTDYVTADIEAVEQIASLVQDLTERTRAAEAVTASEARFRQLADATFEGIAISERGMLVDVNSQLCAMLGYEPVEMIGKPVLDFVAPESRSLVQQNMRAGVEAAYENVLLRKDGSTVHVLSRARSMPWQGKQLRVTALIDITAVRRTEEQLRKLSRAVEQSPASIVITDREGRIEYVNPRFEQVTGYTREETIGQNPRILKSGVTAPQVYEDLWKAITAGGEWRGELCNRKKSGELFWEYAAISGLQGDDGQVTHYVAVKEDISERKRLEEVRMHSQRQEALGTLAGGIAHDFNNILAAIRGNTELAAADVGAEHPAMESLAEITKAGSRASELVRRIMAFGRPQPPRREAADLGEVVDEVLKLLRSTLPAGIALRTHFGRDVPRVLVDSAQVHEVVVNLTTNAAHAIGPRAGSIEYELKAVEREPRQADGFDLAPGRYARLTVKDSGCGMDNATMSRIFDAFYTTKPVGEGTGLGLSMVYGIMHSHGGTVAVDSAPGKGASFHLYFPVAAGDAEQTPGDAAIKAALSAGQRVLYVDDEEALVFLATRVLARFGHSVTGFTDPEAALEAFRAHPADFDVVVTDLSMPQMSGFELTRELLAIRADIPVLMTSGYIRPEDEGRAREVGVSELILKPATMDELAMVLDRTFRSTNPTSQSPAA